MPILQAKGANEYVMMGKHLEQAATAETMVVFSAFRSAVDGLLDIVSVPERAEAVDRAALQNYLTLNTVFDNMQTDMEHLELTLQVIRNRISGV